MCHAPASLAQRARALSAVSPAARQVTVSDPCAPGAPGTHARVRAGRRSASLVYARPTSLACLIGSERTRVPVASKIAFASAGATGGVPGSPMPPHLAPPDSAR
jgi:hypothetical protein